MGYSITLVEPGAPLVEASNGIKRYKNPTYVDYSDVPNSNDGSINTTYNLSPMFCNLPCGRIGAWTGKAARDVVPDIIKSIDEIAGNPEEYRKYDSPNGWGTTEQAMRFLNECWAVFSAYPDKNIQVD